MTTPEPVGAIETHLSEVFLGRDRVFKRLKAVALPFVDLTTPAQRVAAAEAEFRQNQAISPEVYLGVADLVEDGDVTERLIVMRRLAAADCLESRLKGPRARSAIRDAARRIARMHVDAPPLVGKATEPATAEAVLGNWQDNFAAIRPFVDQVIPKVDHDRAVEMVHRWVEGRQGLFEERRADGWVRLGHGDLRAEHIYCADGGVQLIDCVAFDQDLRVADVLADVAFLAMDLERLAGPRASHALMRDWSEFTAEHHPSTLAHFYVAYRAHVRAKIAILRFADGDDSAALEARQYHDLCLRHLELATVRLVMVGGGPGTGKSTVAAGIAGAIGGAWLRADEVRKDIAGVSHTDHAFCAPGEGIYSDAMGERTRGELARQAALLLEHGNSVVLDSTWASAAAREQVRKVAAAAGAELTEICCELPPAIAKERIARRLASMHDPSDATPDLVNFFDERFEAWPEASVVDTRATSHDCIDQAIGVIVRARCVARDLPEPPPQTADRLHLFEVLVETMT